MLENKSYSTILKLQKIFKMGYVPCRMGQSYYIPENIKIGNIPNCFAHACFNLTNQQLTDFNGEDYHAFRHFVKSIFHLNRYISDDLFTFVKECGLKVNKTNARLPRKNNEWKVALYFGYFGHNKDYHFLLQEKDGSWSGKIGDASKTEVYSNLPKTVKLYSYPYKLYGIYKITNPYASIKQFENESVIEK